MFAVANSSGQFSDFCTFTFGSQPRTQASPQEIDARSYFPVPELSTSRKRKSPWQAPVVESVQVWPRIAATQSLLAQGQERAQCPQHSSSTCTKHIKAEVTGHDNANRNQSPNNCKTETTASSTQTIVSSPLHLQAARDDVVLEAADPDELHLLHLLASTCEAEPVSPASSTAGRSCDEEDETQTPQSFIPLQSASCTASPTCRSDSDSDLEVPRVLRKKCIVREERIRFSWDAAIQEAKRAANCK